MKDIIIGMSGAANQIYGVRLPQYLQPIPDPETHLVLSGRAKNHLAGNKLDR